MCISADQVPRAVNPTSIASGQRGFEDVLDRGEIEVGREIGSNVTVEEFDGIERCAVAGTEVFEQVDYAATVEHVGGEFAHVGEVC